MNDHRGRRAPQRHRTRPRTMILSRATLARPPSGDALPRRTRTMPRALAETSNDAPATYPCAARLRARRSPYPSVWIARPLSAPPARAPLHNCTAVLRGTPHTAPFPCLRSFRAGGLTSATETHERPSHAGAHGTNATCAHGPVARSPRNGEQAGQAKEALGWTGGVGVINRACPCPLPSLSAAVGCAYGVTSRPRRADPPLSPPSGY